MITGVVYFFMAFEIRRISRFRSMMFGEIVFKKIENAFLMFGIYFITRLVQNFSGPHPLPLIINCLRQFLLMAIIAPSIVVTISHWVPTPSEILRSTKLVAYTIGISIGVIFVLLNTIAVTDSKVLSTWGNIQAYEPIWFQSANTPIQLILVHLICQFISPVSFLLLAAIYVRHKRHNYQLASIYNLIPVKWKYLEASLIIFAFSFVVAGIAVICGKYYTYIWSIYFVGAIISGVLEMRNIKLPPREMPNDLK
jgi:hypothetical protein